jgi:L-aminopeptidase/D-esterase-like protein
VTMKNAVFWDVTRRGSCKNGRFGGTYRPHQQVEKMGELGTTLGVTVTFSQSASVAGYC